MSCPARYRPLMSPSALEKFGYGAAVVVLVLQGRMHPSDMLFACTDLLLGALFVIAYLKTSPRLAWQAAEMSSRRQPEPTERPAERENLSLLFCGTAILGCARPAWRRGRF
jgi:hypothetical protein